MVNGYAGVRHFRFYFTFPTNNAMFMQIIAVFRVFESMTFISDNCLRSLVRASGTALVMPNPFLSILGAGRICT